MKQHEYLLIAVLLLAGIWGFGMLTIGDSSEDNLAVTINGIEIKEDASLLVVFGALRDVDYVSSKNAFVVLPGQSVTIETAVYHPDSASNGAWYRTFAYTEYTHLVSSVAVFLEPDGIKESTITHRVPTSEGRYTICVESEVKAFSDITYRFDDLDCFTIEVKLEDPCHGVDCNSYCVGDVYYTTGHCEGGHCVYDNIGRVLGKCGYTAPAPDPCDGVTCPNKCIGTYWGTSGYCDDGDCIYSKEKIDGKCGYTAPTPTITPTDSPAPTVTPTATGTNGSEEPTDDDIMPVLILMGGTVGLLALLYFALKARKR